MQTKTKPKLKINLASFSNNEQTRKSIKEPYSTTNNSLKNSLKEKVSELSMPPIIRQTPGQGSRPASISKIQNKNSFMNHFNIETPPPLKKSVVSNLNENKKPTKLNINPARTYHMDKNTNESPFSISNFSKVEKPSFNNLVPSSTKNKVISIMSLFASNLPLDIKHLNAYFPNFDNSKFSHKSLGVVKSYSANTHQGTVRDYNEDRVSIILNIVKPNSYTGTFWPKCSFFGIYDGHGGSGCAEFLRDNLHNFVVRDHNFPVNPKEAIVQGFKAAESEFIHNYALGYNGFDIKDRSGSCAIVSLIVDDIVYVANVGDSRAILSKNCGKEIIQISKDHKPDDETESKRITEAGGKVYQ